jgi:TolB-like protein/DNA-binding winged helix-turn-helix (wHTH) protein/Tfp pilus assembly protein PilF
MMQPDSPGARSDAPATLLRVDDLVVDLDRQSVMRGAEPVELTDRSFRLFRALVRNAPGPVSKDRLIAEVWDDAVVSDETLAQRVRLLRQALGDDSQDPRYVASVRGRGYRMVAPVSEADPGTVSGGRGVTWIAVAAAGVFVVLLAWWMGTTTESGNGTHNGAADVLAVLPFTDLSASQDHQFFADGMHEELLTRLSMIDDLAVISRTSVERYRDSGMSLPGIASELGADAVVEGSLRVEGDRLRVTVQLIDAESDEHVWASNYDSELSIEDIFGLQTELANRIAEALELEYSNSRGGDGQLPTTSLDAYNAYLLGRYHTFRQTQQDLEAAVGFLTTATELDPEFAEAYAALGWAYSFLGAEYGIQSPGAMYPLAKEAALRAIALDPELPDARTLYADILTWYDWDFPAAEREYLKTLEVDPLNVLGYALFLSVNERHDEALAAIERRIAADPNDPYVWINAGWRYLDAGMPDKAIAAAEQAADHRDRPYVLGFGRLAQGDTAAAVEIFENVLEKGGRTPRNLSNLAVASFHDGRHARAASLLGELAAMRENRYVSPALLASVYFAAGDADAGYAMLETAFEERSRDLIFLRVNAMLDGYREDPRYRSLLERVGLM